MSQSSRIVTVKELTRYIKMRLESDQVLQNVWVRGEISNFTHHSSGHMYFTLKDADSRIKCIMFASHNARLAFLPKEGTRVLARGNISLYERDGQYQLYLVEMQPDGIGNLYLAFEQLKRKLELEGLFQEARKRILPRYPKVIGVITSPTGAAVRDIITTLQRRHPSAAIVLYPVSVQGVHAAPSIVKAIEVMNRIGEADVLIVGRGGGSLEELWAFNEEAVARAIYHSRIPVISAVGHETDFTIADFTADVRAATPTAAAELAVQHHQELQQQLSQAKERMQKNLLRLTQATRQRLMKLSSSTIFTQPHRYMLSHTERLDRLKDRLRAAADRRVSLSRERMIRAAGRLGAQHPQRGIVQAKGQLAAITQRMIHVMNNHSRASKANLLMAIRQLDALSPLKVMQRGYSLIYDEQEQQLIKSIGQVQTGDTIQVRLSDGKLQCQVWGMEGEEQREGDKGTAI